MSFPRNALPRDVFQGALRRIGRPALRGLIRAVEDDNLVFAFLASQALRNRGLGVRKIVERVGLQELPVRRALERAFRPDGDVQPRWMLARGRTVVSSFPARARGSTSSRPWAARGALFTAVR